MSNHIYVTCVKMLCLITELIEFYTLMHND